MWILLLWLLKVLFLLCIWYTACKTIPLHAYIMRISVSLQRKYEHRIDLGWQWRSKAKARKGTFWDGHCRASWAALFTRWNASIFATSVFLLRMSWGTTFAWSPMQLPWDAGGRNVKMIYLNFYLQECDYKDEDPICCCGECDIERKAVCETDSSTTAGRWHYPLCDSTCGTSGILAYKTMISTH